MAADSRRDDGPVRLSDLSRAVLDALVESNPELAAIRSEMIEAAGDLVRCWRSGGTLYLCGNGGSHADALHIAGELVKSFERPRPLDEGLREALERSPSPYGDELAGCLQAGLRTVTLGANGAVATAIANDMSPAGIGFAQELAALGRAGDVLLVLSTSGTSRSAILAAVAARALGMTVVALVGRAPVGAPSDAAPTRLADFADVAIAAPAEHTAEVQGWHVRIYHCLCGMVEEELFGP